jgi:hypothetical protein
MRVRPARPGNRPGSTRAADRASAARHARTGPAQSRSPAAVGNPGNTPYDSGGATRELKGPANVHEITVTRRHTGWQIDPRPAPCSNGKNRRDTELLTLVATNGAASLLRAFEAIKDTNARRAVVTVAKACATKV